MSGNDVPPGAPGVGAPDGGQSGSDGGGLSKLASLSAGAIATLVTVAQNPKEWAYGLIAEWIVKKIIGAAKYILGWVFFAADRVASIILDGLGPLATPFEIIGDAFVGVIETVNGVALGVAHSAGLAGPPAAAAAVALVTTVLAVLTFALWRAFPVSTEILSGGLEGLR